MRSDPPFERRGRRGRARVSLRRAVAVATGALALLATIVCGSLVVLTSIVHGASHTMAASVEAVRLAEEAEVDLLLLQRADVALRAEIATSLRPKLAAASLLSTGPEERETRRLAGLDVDRYVRSLDDPALAGEVGPRLEIAYQALERVVDLELDRAHVAQARIDFWDRTGQAIGVGVALLVVAVAVALIAFLSRAARPLVGLAAAMDRFARGAVEARAEPDGPAELREMACRFNDMAEALERQRKAELTFLASVAHELRNPLCALRLSVERVVPDKPLPSEARIRRAFELVRRQVERLERMVSDFLDAARIEAGELELRREPRDLREVVRDVAELFESTSRAHDLVVEVPDRPVTAEVDALRLGQVLTNLVSNAIKYSPEGGPVVVRLDADAERVTLAVEDRGIGMSEAEVRSVFEPFRRTGRLRGEVAGVGLGLAVVRRIVEAHGGTIGVRSAPGRGTTFVVGLRGSRGTSVATAAAAVP